MATRIHEILGRALGKKPDDWSVAEIRNALSVACEQGDERCFIRVDADRLTDEEVTLVAYALCAYGYDTATQILRAVDYAQKVTDEVAYAEFMGTTPQFVSLWKIPPCDRDDERLVY